MTPKASQALTNNALPDATHDGDRILATEGRAGASATAHRATRTDLSLRADPSLRVLKRDGTHEIVDPLQIVLKVASAAESLANIDVQMVAEKAIRGLYDGVSTAELDHLLI